MKELAHIAHLLYPVEKVPSEEVSPGFNFTPAQEFAIVVDMGDKGKKVVNHCSKLYEVVSNRQVLEPLVKAFKGSDIQIRGTQRYDSRFKFDILFNDKTLSMGGKDNIMPKLSMNNSYDGRVKWAFNLGFFRMICSNGMVIPLEGFEDKNIQLKMRHTPSIESYADPIEILEMVNDFKANSKLFMEPYKELQKKKVVSMVDRVQEVIANTNFPTRRAEDVEDRIISEMSQLNLASKDLNDWLIYNGLNYQLNHSDDIQMDEHKKDKLDQEILSYLIAS